MPRTHVVLLRLKRSVLCRVEWRRKFGEEEEIFFAGLLFSIAFFLFKFVLCIRRYYMLALLAAFIFCPVCSLLLFRQVPTADNSVALVVAVLSLIVEIFTVPLSYRSFFS